MSKLKTRSHIYVGSDFVSRIRRGLLYAVGMTREQIERPFVAIVNTWNELHSGHVHLDRLAKRARVNLILFKQANLISL